VPRHDHPDCARRRRPRRRRQRQDDRSRARLQASRDRRPPAMTLLIATQCRPEGGRRPLSVEWVCPPLRLLTAGIFPAVLVPSSSVAAVARKSAGASLAQVATVTGGTSGEGHGVVCQSRAPGAALPESVGLRLPRSADRGPQRARQSSLLAYPFVQRGSRLACGCGSRLACGSRRWPPRSGSPACPRGRRRTW